MKITETLCVSLQVGESSTWGLGHGKNFQVHITCCGFRGLCGLSIWSGPFLLVRTLTSSFSVFVTPTQYRKWNSSVQFWFSACNWQGSEEKTSLLRKWRLWWRRETAVSLRWVYLPVCSSLCRFVCLSTVSVVDQYYSDRTILWNVLFVDCLLFIDYKVRCQQQH